MSILSNITASERLLPSIQQVEHKKAIQLSRIITVISKKALLAFQEGRLDRFDAPVGDNSCKIRAAKIADIFQRLKNSKKFSNEIKILLEKINEIEDKLSRIKQTKNKNKPSLKDFRIKQGIEFSIDSDLEFLITAHFLFLVKKIGSYNQTDHSVLQGIESIANSAAKNWIHKMKENLANSSVRFIQEQAEIVGGSRHEILKKMVSKLFIRIYEKRPVLPNFHCMEILLKRALQQDRFVILKISEPGEKINILCKPNKNKTTFIPVDLQEKDLEMPAIVIEAKRTKKVQRAFFQDHDLFRLLLITASQDPQYLSGRRTEDIPFVKLSDDLSVQDEQKRFNGLIKQANEMGVSSKNPIYFLIQHMFCDRVDNHMNLTN